MKKIFNISKFILIYTLFYFFTTFSYSQPYHFEITPGTKEWSTLKTESERLEVLNIPSSMLHEIDTKDLIITCLNYPAFGHYTAYNSLQKGFDHIFNNFNGLQNLFSRNDAAINLLKIYQSANLNFFKNNSLGIMKSYSFIRFNWLELILAQNKIIQQLTPEDKKQLINVCVLTFQQKTKNNLFNSLPAELPTLLIIVRSLEELKYQALFDSPNYSHLQQFSVDPIYLNPEDANILLNLAVQYIHN